ncbi:G-protein alpha subunit (small G protein superfamily) [Handroanthus impetiginosus]|uniref:G-protein alpha subunit (Small G protein superfamily) n=1 Tax=Handroanthus impetiginosus TaxID=429701 RepID=A0A2G9GEG4_9LAMI|nr:G-protein alpha subunit (small G protein superfamily) [Handroanthus impetiginosus]
MSTIYDNWERLVAATLRREQLWQMFHAHSRTPSISSTASDSSSSSQLSDFPFEFSSSSSWYQQNSVPEIGVYGRRYNANDSEAKPRKAEKSQKIKELKELAPGDIFVNGKPLSNRELNMLLRCRYPPKKLRPGNYWYDKVSGFWGKQGQKPSQIISTHLDLGGLLERHASNGDTLVYINNREITKVELRVLQLDDGKLCPGTHLWMNEDGTYQEEGQYSMRGNIWGKMAMKLLWSIFSLPFPPKFSYTTGELFITNHLEQSAFQKILLIGYSGSGTSTIFKQAMFLYKTIPFLEHELEQIKLLIQSNIYRYIRVLLEGHEKFEEENLNESRERQLSDFADHASDRKIIHSFSPRLKAFSDWILKSVESGRMGVFSASFIEATAPFMEELLRSPAFQRMVIRRSESQRVNSFADYFLERAVHIFKPDYQPSHLDILYAEGFPSPLSYMDFSFPPPRDVEVDIGYLQDFMIRYQFIRLNAFGDNETSFEIFEDVRIVIFCVSLCDYDQFVTDENGSLVNKMIYHRQCFESKVTNPIFDQKGFLLLLTKYDLFEEKIEHVPLNQCDWFDDFHPVGKQGRIGEKGFYYISIKFKRLYTALTGRKLYVTKVNCLKQDSVDEALKYARNMLKWEEETSDCSYTYYSSG